MSNKIYFDNPNSISAENDVRTEEMMYFNKVKEAVTIEDKKYESLFWFMKTYIGEYIIDIITEQIRSRYYYRDDIVVSIDVQKCINKLYIEKNILDVSARKLCEEIFNGENNIIVQYIFRDFIEKYLHISLKSCVFTNEINYSSAQSGFTPISNPIIQLKIETRQFLDFRMMEA